MNIKLVQQELPATDKFDYMKKIFLAGVITFILFSETVAAQNVLPVFRNDSITINNYLYKYVTANFSLEKYDTLCLSACTFIKFKVNGKGNIEELRFTYNTPAIIKTIFTNALLSTNGSWKYKSGKLVGSKMIPFVLPVTFIFENNCRPADRAVNGVLDILTDDTDADAGKPGLPGTKNKKPLQCIILNPLFIKSGYN
jgi:hypothetical protein